jgi:hypothetical protein
VHVLRVARSLLAARRLDIGQGPLGHCCGLRRRRGRCSISGTVNKEASGGCDFTYPIFARVDVEFNVVWPLAVVVDVLADFELRENGAWLHVSRAGTHTGFWAHTFADENGGYVGEVGIVVGDLGCVFDHGAALDWRAQWLSLVIPGSQVRGVPEVAQREVDVAVAVGVFRVAVHDGCN